MKKISFLLLGVAFLISSCVKEDTDQIQDLVTAINELDTETGHTSTVIYILKNDDLCHKIDCLKNKREEGNKKVEIYSREGLFMRGVKSYYHVVKWEERPEVRYKIWERIDSSEEDKTEKCRGN